MVHQESCHSESYALEETKAYHIATPHRDLSIDLQCWLGPVILMTSNAYLIKNLNKNGREKSITNKFVREFPVIKRASVADIKNQTISKSDGHLVVTMRVYPRFLPKALIDDFKQSLSPQKDLFSRYREFKKKTGDQNQSFESARYQQEFQLSEQGLRDLSELVEISKTQDVFMICQCHPSECCHVDLMLLIAEVQFGADINTLPFEYSIFRKRLMPPK